MTSADLGAALRAGASGAVFGVFGDGQYRLQPMHVDDFAELAVEQGKERANRVIDAIGPETFTYRRLVQEIGSIIGIKPSDDPKADELRNSNMPIQDRDPALGEEEPVEALLSASIPLTATIPIGVNGQYPTLLPKESLSQRIHCLMGQVWVKEGDRNHVTTSGVSFFPLNL